MIPPAPLLPREGPQVHGPAAVWRQPTAGPWGGYTLRALPPPLDRNHGSPSLSTPTAPDPVLEVEHLGLGAKPEPQQKLRREQRDVVASRAIDLDEVALPEILNPRGVKGHHLCASVPGMFQESARAGPRQWLSRHGGQPSPFGRAGGGESQSGSEAALLDRKAGPQGTNWICASAATHGARQPYSSGIPALRRPAK
jgi:hypothetical protein